MTSAFPYPIYEFRPINPSEDEVLRYANNAWIPDDGQYDLAFIIPERFLALYIDLPYRLHVKWHLQNWNDRLPCRGNYYHHYQLSYGRRVSDWDFTLRNSHPNVIAGALAMSKLSHIKSCANGFNVEVTNPKDPYLINGLVRDHITKKVIIPPKSLTCSYCRRRIRVR